MADLRFFRKEPSFTLAELAKLTGANLSETADPAMRITDVAPLDAADSHKVSFLDNPKYVDAFSRSQAGACFVATKHAGKAPADMALLLSENPYLAYALAATAFYPAPVSNAKIAPQAVIHESATIGSGCEIGAGAVISENAVIGDNCVIAPNAVIGSGVTIGNHTRIGAGCAITHALIGSKVILHPNVSIGQDGFGFARSPQGAVKVPQLGRVIIEDDVEIGAGSTVDRGAGPDTVIGYGTKIDNLVQIGHNVRIGRFVTIVAQVGIGGSAEIGDGTIIAGQAGVAGHLKVGRGVIIAARSGVTNYVPDGASYGGFPAVPIMEWRRQVAALSRLLKKKGKEND